MDRVNRDELYFAGFEALRARFVAETDRALACERIAQKYGDERYQRFAVMHRHVADRIAESMWRCSEWLVWEQEMTPHASWRTRVAGRVAAWWAPRRARWTLVLSVVTVAIVLAGACVAQWPA